MLAAALAVLALVLLVAVAFFATLLFFRRLLLLLLLLLASRSISVRFFLVIFIVIFAVAVVAAAVAEPRALPLFRLFLCLPPSPLPAAECRQEPARAAAQAALDRAEAQERDQSEASQGDDDLLGAVLMKKVRRGRVKT